MNEDLTKDDYQAAVIACHVAARMLAQHPIDKLLEAIERADSIGPILDPSLWMKKRDAMNDDREVLRAARKLAEIGRHLAEQEEEV